MILSFILKMFFLQLVIFAIIFFVLLFILNRQLKQEALHQLEFFLERNRDLKFQTIILFFSGQPAEKFCLQVKQIAQKNWNQEPSILTKTDSGMKGGVIIELRERRFDYSVRNRLRESGILK